MRDDSGCAECLHGNHGQNKCWHGWTEQWDGLQLWGHIESERGSGCRCGHDREQRERQEELDAAAARGAVAGHAAGVAEERARWTEVIAAERETWLTLGPPWCERNVDAAIRNILIRMGIAQ